MPQLECYRSEFNMLPCYTLVWMRGGLDYIIIAINDLMISFQVIEPFFGHRSAALNYPLIEM